MSFATVIALWVEKIGTPYYHKKTPEKAIKKIQRKRIMLS